MFKIKVSRNETGEIPTARLPQHTLSMGPDGQVGHEAWCRPLVLTRLQQNPRPHFLNNQRRRRDRSQFFSKRRHTAKSTTHPAFKGRWRRALPQVWFCLDARRRFSRLDHVPRTSSVCSKPRASCHCPPLLCKGKRKTTPSQLGGSQCHAFPLPPRSQATLTDGRKSQFQA